MVVGPLVETFGPFLIAVALFVLGVIAYGGFIALQRFRTRNDESDSKDG